MWNWPIKVISILILQKTVGKFKSMSSNSFRTFMQKNYTLVNLLCLIWFRYMLHRYLAATVCVSHVLFIYDWLYCYYHLVVIHSVHLYQEWICCSGGKPVDRLESNSRTVKGAKIIGQEKEALTLILKPVQTFSKGKGNPVR